IQKLGERFHLSEQLLSTELAKLISGNKEREEQRHQRFERTDIHEEPDADVSDEPIPLSEGALLEAVLHAPVEVSHLLESSEFNFNLLTHHSVRELISYIMQRVEESDPPTLAQLHQEY